MTLLSDGGSLILPALKGTLKVPQCSDIEGMRYELGKGIWGVLEVSILDVCVCMLRDMDVVEGCDTVCYGKSPGSKMAKGGCETDKTRRIACCL